MSSRIYKLKENLLNSFPEKKYHGMIFEVLDLRTGLSWEKIGKNTEVPPEIIKKSMRIIDSIFKIHG